MGSVSTYVTGGFGGLKGRPLKPGDELFVSESNHFIPNLSISPPSLASKNVVLRVIFGPQENLFTEKGKKRLTSSTYTTSVRSNRVGIRLEGPTISHVNGADVISDGTAFGTIQVPGDGLPIILASDRGSTGGYAKIATVITADHTKLAQLMPGNSVQFKRVDFKDAITAMRDEQNRIKFY
jgi:biotin-dependent carboxylase-like uncharacterized protein